MVVIWVSKWQRAMRTLVWRLLSISIHKNYVFSMVGSNKKTFYIHWPIAAIRVWAYFVQCRCYLHVPKQNIALIAWISLNCSKTKRGRWFWISASTPSMLVFYAKELEFTKNVACWGKLLYKSMCAWSGRLSKGWSLVARTLFPDYSSNATIFKICSDSKNHCQVVHSSNSL